MLVSLPVAAAIAVLVSGSPAVRGQVCPASATLCQSGDYMTGETAATTTSPTFEKHCSGPVMNVEDASFDIPAGKFSLAVGEGGEMRLWLRDAFTVTGPAPGTPIALHMRVRMQGYINWTGCCPDSQLFVGLSALEPQPSDPAPHWSLLKAGPYNAELYSDSLDITLQRNAGEPVGIAIYALDRIHNAGSARLEGTFTFVDLQPGWTVSSCKGYALDQPTPTVPGSWGRVKAAYR